MESASVTCPDSPLPQNRSTPASCLARAVTTRSTALTESRELELAYDVYPTAKRPLYDSSAVPVCSARESTSAKKRDWVCDEANEPRSCRSPMGFVFMLT